MKIYLAGAPPGKCVLDETKMVLKKHPRMLLSYHFVSTDQLQQKVVFEEVMIPLTRRKK
jgi:hypothetical protein